MAEQEQIDAMNARDTSAVIALCERIGYGFVMHEAARAWARKDDVAAHTVGPARCCTTPCNHRSGSSCEKCYGCGWTFRKAAPKKARKARG